jgi:nucleosome assembly protein 1-like 1
MADKKDPDQAELEFKICRDINNMGESVRDRFKAMFTQYEQANQLNDEEEKEHRALELKYEKLYQEVYAKRALLLSGEKSAVDAELIMKFDERAEIFEDKETFPDVETRHCDVKEIQNTPAGVSGFWLKAMCANQMVASHVHEKDRPILGYLQNITMDQHEEDFGFDLTFHFEKNSYFAETELKKQFFMKQQMTVERAVGTTISWTPGSDVTKTKKKKGKGKKKVNVTVKCESFFNLFETVEASKLKKSMPGDDSEEEEDPEAEQLEDDMELGTAIRDDLIPLALEYYLGVIEQQEDDDDDGDDDDDDDEEDMPKPKKTKKPSAGASDKSAEGKDGETGKDKEQECK